MSEEKKKDFAIIFAVIGIIIGVVAGYIIHGSQGQPNLDCVTDEWEYAIAHPSEELAGFQHSEFVSPNMTLFEVKLQYDAHGKSRDFVKNTIGRILRLCSK